ncbi:DoxX family protein [Chitinophaga nivalis]|uniref:DoxX family protein n=1 Tax=Chitinophaga nivalis TaxID=2991709 RepID=A0ABT3IMV5_9BACT|nr:DoxX family protein [Chitinophaga nivalis]MCW3465013.1 DoxX family protein [Chitinophaga nivalis]MCW3485295.1 DoxX family protein [Chitinophaga nivalis]
MFKKRLAAMAHVAIGVVLIRIIAGLLIFVHGCGIFHPGHMEGNIAWLTDLHFPIPVGMAYLGKGAELVGGAFLMLGLLTRMAAAVLVINMGVITFIMGTGKVFTDDQPPFLFLVLFLYLLIAGGGKYSLDRLWWGKRSAS